MKGPSYTMESHGRPEHNESGHERPEQNESSHERHQHDAAAAPQRGATAIPQPRAKTRVGRPHRRPGPSRARPRRRPSPIRQDPDKKGDDGAAHVAAAAEQGVCGWRVADVREAGDWPPSRPARRRKRATAHARASRRSMRATAHRASIPTRAAPHAQHRTRYRPAENSCLANSRTH